MSNIIITTHWSDGDVIPFIDIGRNLKARGHDVTIFTHCCYEERVKSEGMNFVAWDTLSEYNSLFADLVNTSNVIEKDEIQKFREKHQNSQIRIKEYKLMELYCQKDDTVIIAKNRSSIAALLIAEKLNKPIIWVYMNPYEYESMMNFDKLNGKKLCEESNDLRRKLGLKPIDSWIDWQCSPKIKVGLWPKWYKSQLINQPPNIKLVGFPLKRRQKCTSNMSDKLRSLLLQTTKPIIISGGSSKGLNKNFYKIAIKCAEKFNRNVIVATKYKEFLPDKLSDNVYVFDYIPMYECLTYAGVIINHGGIGTVSNAISLGIPQLILADYVDRPLNGAIVKKLGLGEYLPPIKWNEDEITERLKMLLTVEYRERCLNFIEKYNDEDTFENIIKIIEDFKENDEYLIKYEDIKCKKNKGNELRKNHNSLDSMSNSMKKYLAQRVKNKMKEKEDGRSE